MQHGGEDVEQEVERVAVQEVHLVQVVERQVDQGAGLGQLGVLRGHLLHLGHDHVGLGGLARHFAGLALQLLQRRDHRVVVQDLALGLVQRAEQGAFQLSQTHRELALQFQQVVALLVDVRPLAAQHLVQTLRLQAGAGDREVDKSDSRTNVGREFHLKRMKMRCTH